MSLVDTVILHNLIGFNEKTKAGGTMGLATDRNYLAFGEMKSGVSCHIATVYWLLTEINGTIPGLTDLASAPGQIKAMLPHGHRRLRPPSGPLLLNSGSVVVFVSNGDPQHSCVALTGDLVGGYNQNGWFYQGLDHRYSTHLVTGLRWGTGANKDKVLRNEGDFYYELWQISETAAKQSLGG